MNTLIIGSTGINGIPICNLLLIMKCNVYAISLEKNHSYNPNVIQIEVDRKDILKFQTKLDELKIDKWDVIIDLIQFSIDDASNLYNLIRFKVKHLIIISTTLVYKRNSTENRIFNELDELAAIGQLGGYVDNKIEIELFWKGISDVNWTILRPYHILGSYSALGCLPFHNRDINLIEKIVNSEDLRLFMGGNIEASFINPFDLATFIIRLIHKKAAYFNAFNACHPEIFIIKDYYHFIGEVLQKKIRIRSIELDEYLNSDYGWELTTLQHRYDCRKIYELTKYYPIIDLKMSILQSIQTHNNNNHNANMVSARMNLKPKPQIY